MRVPNSFRFSLSGVVVDVRSDWPDPPTELVGRQPDSGLLGILLPSNK